MKYTGLSCGKRYLQIINENSGYYCFFFPSKIVFQEAKHCIVIFFLDVNTLENIKRKNSSN
jgi:hypothetical protein